MYKDEFEKQKLYLVVLIRENKWWKTKQILWCSDWTDPADVDVNALTNGVFVNW